MAYVCKELHVIEGVQTCAMWVEQSTLIPELTYTEANLIGGAFMSVMVAVWVINQIKFAIKRT